MARRQLCLFVRLFVDSEGPPEKADCSRLDVKLLLNKTRTIWSSYTENLIPSK